MDWFERITGFKELGYEETRSALSVVDGKLRSVHSQRTCFFGELETPSLNELRDRTRELVRSGGGAVRVSTLQGDVRRLHTQPVNNSALFQVASQFNLLEMIGPDVTPEAGVTGYQQDRTQGPACAMAAGAATIYRNYLMPVDGGTGQTSRRQVDCLADLGKALAGSAAPFWQMRNGYALCSQEGLATIDSMLASSPAEKTDALRGLLRIGVHWSVEATESATPGQRVTQAFCSALPVSYSSIPPARWQRFATLVLEAAYEATLLAALLNRERTGCPTVFLTSLGGGAFGNEQSWIDSAMARAFDAVKGCELDVRIVSFGPAAQSKK
jgi:hypothetical protein